MTDSKTVNTKCFSGIVRRLLCTGSLPTHPSDHITESNTTHALTQLNKTEFDYQPKKTPKTPAKVEASAATTPGLVARLMGLESLPVPRTLDSIARSRSVNSIDYFIELDPLQTQHRRFRTSSSLSFRELPSYLDQKNQDLLVFYLENVDENKEMGLKQRKTEVGFGELKHKKLVERSYKNKENMMREKVHVTKKKKENVENKKKASKGKEESRNVNSKRSTSKVGDCSGAKDVLFVLPHKRDVYRKPRATLKTKNPLKPVNQKEVFVGSKFINKRRSQQSVKKELECNAENSSPVSGPDLKNFSIHPNSPLSGDSRPTVLNSRRKSSPRINNNAIYNFPSPHNIARKTNTDGLELGAIIKNKDYESVKTRETEYYIEVLGGICRLTEKDIKESNWVDKEVCNKLDDFEEICMEFGQHILDIQLHQVVNELVEYHNTKF